MSESAAFGQVSDLLATQLQRDGRGTMLGLTLSDVIVTLDAIGLTPTEVIISAGSQIVCRPSAWQGVEESIRTPGDPFGE